jgi:hypothetical protein
MIFVIRLTAIPIFILLLNGVQHPQTDFDAQFEYAKTLYEQEKYFDSVTELKRLLFFEQTDRYNYSAYMLIGRCYKQGAKFSSAINYVSLAEMNASNNKEIFDAKLEIIRLNILRRTTNQALKLIEQLDKTELINARQDELNYWRGWAYIFADDWRSAAESFSLIDEKHELKLLADDVEEEKYSVSFAKTISYLVPGAGQFYTGEYLYGIISLGWNVLWGYLTINAFIDDRVFDGFMIGSLLWMRFYRGNFQNAEAFALQKNLDITNKALNYLQFEYKGLKP